MALEQKLNADFFIPAIGSAFIIDTNIGTIPMTLEEVICKDSYNNGPFHCFYLIFTGPGEIFFHEGSYSLIHETLGSQVIHIAPTGKTETGYRYQAIFSIAK